MNAVKLVDPGLRDVIVAAYGGLPAGPQLGGDKTTALLPEVPSALNALDVDEAYVLQAAVAGSWAEHPDGARAGYKISCTAAADRALIGSPEPVYGTLARAHLRVTGQHIYLDGANGALVEPELLLRVMAPIPDEASPTDLADLVEVAAALEVPMSRFDAWWPEGALPNLTLGGLIGDNAVAGLVVHSDDWTRLSAQEIDQTTVTVTGPGGVASSGSAGNVMGSPLIALRWLVGATRRRGQDLPVGSVVSSGTFTRPMWGKPGTYRATFSSLTPVSLTFVAGSAHGR